MELQTQLSFIPDPTAILTVDQFKTGSLHQK